MSILSNNFYYQPLKIDSINTKVYGDFIAKEGDANGRGLLVTLTENGLQKDTTGITLNLKWAHTTVLGLQNLDPFESVDLTKGLYKITYPTDMLRKGKVDAFIQIIDSGKLIGSRNIKINVEATVGDDTAIESSNEFRALASALVEVNGWNDRIDAVEADFIQRANDMEATYPQELLSLGSQLAEATPYRNLEIKSVNWYATSPGQFISARATEILNKLVVDGFNSIAIVPMWYMQTYTSNEILSSDPKTTPNSEIITLIQNAHALGLNVILKPHVEVNDGTPRSHIAPTDWNSWFTNYNAYIMNMAQLAQDNGVEYFVVGTELQSASNSSHRTNWENIIANVRTIYTNPITYASIYFGEAQTVCFWDLVDLIGINLWSGRTTKNPYTIQDIYDSFYLNQNSRNDVSIIKGISDQYGIPVLLTEIGCISYSGALARPSLYRGIEDIVNTQVPADFAEAMFAVISQNTDWIKGYCWWDIHINQEDLFSFEGKPTELVLKDWNSRNYSDAIPLSSIAKTHGFNIFTEENHNEIGDPHPQYVLESSQKPFKINQVTSNADLNKYTKLFEVKLDTIYDMQELTFDFYGTTAGNVRVEYGLVYLRVYQHAALGAVPYIELTLDGNSALTTNNFVAVITQNDSLATVVQLHYKVTIKNEYLYYEVNRDITSPYGNVFTTFYELQSYNSALPSGQQINSTYTDRQFNSLKIGAGNYDVLHTGNHNATGDPHPQYLTKKGQAKVQQATATGYYGKIASVTLSSQYGNSVNLFSVSGFASAANPQKGLLWIRCYQANALGTPPTIDMKLFNSKGLKPSDIIAVITKNDATSTVIEFYISIKVAYDTLYFNLLHTENTAITLFVNQALTVSLPAGTQVLATYDDVLIASPNGTIYKLNVDNSGVLSASTLP